ncbi:MAG: DUF2382 domain-containing protein [Verrucomicrobiales bacterium]
MNKSNNKGDANRDPITGEPGSHPVGTGVGAAVGGAGGAAAGAAAGAALGTAGAGPVGTAVGAVAGAIAGAAAGHGTAEGLNPTTSHDEGRYIDYAVVDQNSDKIGTVESVWLDGSNEPAYLSVRTGWLGMGRTYVVPAQSAHVSQRRREIKVPYTLEQLKGAPDFDSSAQLQTADEDRIGSYYGNYGFRREGWLENRAEATAAPGTRKLDANDQTNIRLKEENVTIGKREVEYGGVRLRKVIRTEVVNQPVELKREEIVVERVPASDTSVHGDFSEEELYVPLRREEAVVGKDVRVREEVRIGKRSETEQTTVSETVRKEDVEIEDSPSRMDATGERSKTPRYQPKERSRS